MEAVRYKREKKAEGCEECPKKSVWEKQNVSSVRAEKYKVLPGDSIDVVAEQIKSLLRCATADLFVSDALVAVLLVDALPKMVAEKVTMRHGEVMQLKKIVNAAKAQMVSMESATCAAAAGHCDWKRGQNAATGRSSQNIRCHGGQRLGHEKECLVICCRCWMRGHV